MAKVLGETGRYVSDQSVKKYQKQFLVLFFVFFSLAFPSAYIEAKWGTTGYIHCVKDEQLYDYIVENKKAKKLSQKEIESISQAFLALARMDKDFT